MPKNFPPTPELSDLKISFYNTGRLVWGGPERVQAAAQLRFLQGRANGWARAKPNTATLLEDGGHEARLRPTTTTSLANGTVDLVEYFLYSITTPNLVTRHVGASSTTWTVLPGHPWSRLVTNLFPNGTLLFQGPQALASNAYQRVKEIQARSPVLSILLLTALCETKTICYDLPNYTSMATLWRMVTEAEGTCDILHIDNRVLPVDGTLNEAGIGHGACIRHNVCPLKGGSQRIPRSKKPTTLSDFEYGKSAPATSKPKTKQKKSDELGQYEVTEFMDSFHQNGQVVFVVRYKDYHKPETNTYKGLWKCTELAQAFHAKHPGKPMGQFQYLFEENAAKVDAPQDAPAQKTSTTTTSRRGRPSTRGPPIPGSTAEVLGLTPLAELQRAPAPEAPPDEPLEPVTETLSPLSDHVERFSATETDLTEQDLTVMLIHMHLLSRKLRHIPKADKWAHIKKPLRRQWRTRTSAAAPTLNAALDQWEGSRKTKPDEDALTKVIIRILALPAMILLPAMNIRAANQPFVIDNLGDSPTYFNDLDRPDSPPTSTAPMHPDHLDTLAGRDPQTARAVKQALAGNWSQAAKCLLSNGVAQGSAEVANHIAKLHVARPSPPQRGKTNKTQDHVGTADVLAQMKKNASTSIDFFGYRADFISEIANTAFGKALARTIALFANCQLPALANRALLAGSITALNKVEPEAQRSDPKIRPVNSGSLLQKCATKARTKAKSYQEALKSMPHQFGLAKAGPEIVAHGCRLEYARGSPIFGGDAVQAFQRLDREIMLKETAKRWPEATDLANMMYGEPSLAIYTYPGEDGLLHVRLNYSQDGARMGCVLGSTLYDLGVAPLHDKLANKYPSFTLRALTDDIIAAAAPPRSEAEWHEFYLRYADYLFDLKEWGEPIGYTLHPEKLFLLLPPHAPPIDADTRARLPPDLCITREGRKISGAFIGTDKYVQEETLAQANQLVAKLEKIKTMGHLQPQIAMRLVKYVVVGALVYACRVNPPSLMTDASRLVDMALRSARLSILKDPNSPNGSIERGRLERAHTVAQLPCRDGGLGHTPVDVLASPAYLSSLAVSTKDPFVQSHLHLLHDVIAFAHAEVLGKVGTDPRALAKANSVLPPTPDDIAHGGFFSHHYLTNSKKRVQATLVEAILLKRKNELMDHLCNSTSDAGLTLEDATALLITGNASQLPRILNSDLWYRVNRVPAPQFRHSVRLLLNLPPNSTLGNQVYSPKHGVELDICLHCNAPLDPTAAHAAGCSATRGTATRTHNHLVRTIAELAEQAGCSKRIEPPTEEITLGAFPPTLCAMICPKSSTEAASRLSVEIVKRLWERQRAHSSNNQSEVGRITQELKQLSQQKDIQTSGRRIDVQLVGHDSDEAWIDVSGVHPTASAHASLSRDFALHLAKIKLSNPDAKTVQSSKPLSDRAETKRRTYRPLLDVADRQTKARDRVKAPTFFPAIFSNFGEFSTDMFLLIEWLVKQYKTQLLSENHPHPGLSTNQATAKFRSHCKDTLASTIATGLGTLMERAGLAVPQPGRRSNATSSLPPSSPVFTTTPAEADNRIAQDFLETFTSPLNPNSPSFIPHASYLPPPPSSLPTSPPPPSIPAFHNSDDLPPLPTSSPTSTLFLST